MRTTAIVLVLLTLVGCSSSGKRAHVAHAPPGDPWVLTSLDAEAEKDALLWNPAIGIRVKADGTATNVMFYSNRHDQTPEEKISPQPNPMAGRWLVGSRQVPVVPASGRDFSQKLDMRTGELLTTWTQDVDGVTLTVQCRTVLDLQFTLVGQRWSFSAPKKTNLQFRSETFDGLGVRNEQGGGLVEWTRDYSATVVQHFSFENGAQSQAEPPLTRSANQFQISGVADKDHPFEVASLTDFSPAQSGGTQGFDGTYEGLAKGAANAWAKRWQTDIEIDGPVEDQQAVRSFLFYLRSAIGLGSNSISPFGLSSEKYNGHVFWDADIWVSPAISLIDPEGAKAIANYRVKTLPQAVTNFRDWLANGRPTASGKMGEATADAEGAKFAWESSVSGRETVPGPSKYEDHVTGSVAFSLMQAAALGLADAREAARVAHDAAVFYLMRSQMTDKGLQIKDVMSPDENHVGDNDLYTNAVAEWTMQSIGGKPAGFYFPKDAESLLTYDNDPLKSYKQAAAVLAIYPLQNPTAEKQARKMMKRFAGKVIKNGPAMTDSLHALISARLGEPDRAYDLWKSSWQEFVTAPHLQFAEKRNHKDTYFTTGAAGCLQTILFGFLGFRIDSKVQEGAEWSTPLLLQQVLSVKPNLPKAWKSVKFKNFIVRGRRYTLIATHNGVQVIQGDH